MGDLVQRNTTKLGWNMGGVMSKNLQYLWNSEDMTKVKMTD